MHSIKIITEVVIIGDTQSHLRKCPVRGDTLRPRPRINNSDAAQPWDDGNFKETGFSIKVFSFHSSYLENAVTLKITTPPSLKLANYQNYQLINPLNPQSDRVGERRCKPQTTVDSSASQADRWLLVLVSSQWKPLHMDVFNEGKIKQNNWDYTA